MLPRFLKICWRVEIFFCIVTAGTKNALGIFQLWFKFFVASFFKRLGIFFSREAGERNAPVVGAFTPVSFFVYGDDHPSLPNHSVSFQNTRPLDTHESAKELLLDSRL